jgi:hypothetical protein
MLVRRSRRAQALLKQILHISRFYVGNTQLVPQSVQLVSAMRSILIMGCMTWATSCALRGKYVYLA